VRTSEALENELVGQVEFSQAAEPILERHCAETQPPLTRSAANCQHKDFTII